MSSTTPDVKLPDGPPSFQDIPLFPRARYSVTVEWGYLEKTIKDHETPPPAERGYKTIAPLNLNPDFQRAHVWHEWQQRAYIEYCLRGGEVGRSIIFNCPGWMQDDRGPYEIIDGKQRLSAIRKFMRSELKVYGHYFAEFKGTLRLTNGTLDWRVCSLDTREEVLQFYLSLNAGGTPHTKEELDRVRDLLTQAKEERESHERKPTKKRKPRL